MKTGDILHCSGKGVLARAIQKFTKSKYSHTAVFVRVWGQDYIIDAQANGVNLRPFEEWHKKYNYKFDVTRSSMVSERDFAIRALSKAGVTSCDFSEYVAWCHEWDSPYRMNPKNVYRRALELGHKIIDHPFNK